jgi:hypothetical protein
MLSAHCDAAAGIEIGAVRQNAWIRAGPEVGEGMIFWGTKKSHICPVVPPIGL